MKERLFGCERVILLLELWYERDIMSGRKLQGFSIYIDLPVQVRATPTVKSIVNNFDYHGDLVSLRRLHGESNVDYKKRIWDVTVHPGGSLYEGIINNISRELGLEREPSLEIDLKLSSSGEPIAPNPRVDILANRVVLYSDWRPNGTTVIDREIRTYKLDDPGYYLDDLAAAINESEYFSATLLNNIRPNTISSTIVRGNSDINIIQENVHSDKLLNLNNTNIIRNSLMFLEKKIFDTEVTSTPASDGEYMVNYISGEVESYLQPSGQSYCSYHAAGFPMTVDTAPVQIFTFQDDDYQYELFNHETLDSGEIVNGLPNTEGSETYHKLFKETEVFWGK